MNSLEQLISINQTLSSATGSTTPTGGVTGAGATAASTSGSGTKSVAAAIAASPGAAIGSHSAITPGVGTLGADAHRANLQLAPGNLGLPEANPSALRVAQSLNGRHPAR